jgi:hypothetical protein
MQPQLWVENEVGLTAWFAQCEERIRKNYSPEVFTGASVVCRLTLDDKAHNSFTYS